MIVIEQSTCAYVIFHVFIRCTSKVFILTGATVSYPARITGGEWSNVLNFAVLNVFSTQIGF